MNRNIIALSLSAALALAGCKNESPTAQNPSPAADTATATNPEKANTPPNSGVDTAFITDGIKGDTAELAIAHLAVSKGASKGVRDFANMLVADHSAHKQKLIDLANSANITIPTEASDSGKVQLQKLQKLSGAAFDQALVEALIGNHKKGIAKNEAQAKSGDPRTAELAQETVPVLKKHLATAEGLAK